MTTADAPAGASLESPPEDRIAARIVGRGIELEIVLAAVTTGRDIVLEGPPGTSKTTILRAITAEWGIPLIFVEGNAELTPGRLLGHHNPARVLQEGYSPASFSAGPLVDAMQRGAFLHFEELNRAPDDTLNTLLTAIADREITIPRLGTIRAAPTFRLVASMNPYDNVGTTRLSASIRDRLCRVSIQYQDAEAERDIVVLKTAADPGPVLTRVVSDAVSLTRRTRTHEAVRQGSSVRGAIDLTLLASELARRRGIDNPDDERYARTVFDAMIVALSGRVVVDESSGLNAEAILRQIWEDHFVLDPSLAEPG